MEVSNSNLESLIYRANIFNYDNKFISDVYNKKLKLDLIKNNTDSKIASDFFQQKSKDQIKDIFTLLNESSADQDDIEIIQKSYNNANSNRARTLIRLFLEYLRKTAEDLASGEIKRLNKGGQMEVSDRKQLDEQKIENSDSILYILLFFDGLMMVNVDFVTILSNVADGIGQNLINLLFDILESRFIENASKEIVSHLLSGVLVFNNPEKVEFAYFEKLMRMNFQYITLNKERKRENSFTSNLALLLTYDQCVQYFIETLENECSSLPIICGCLKENNHNMIYEALFCFWNISNNKNYISLFENKRNGYLELIVQVLRTYKVDKIARIGFSIIKNLLESMSCLEILIDLNLMKTIEILLSHKWSDTTLIKELLNSTYDYLEKNYKSLNSFDKYSKEIDSGYLKWNSLHTSNFWEDNFGAFKHNHYEYIEKLVNIIKGVRAFSSEDLEMKCIACFDVGEFARCSPGGAEVLEHFGVKQPLMELIQHQNLELKNRALVCLQKIMMKGVTKKS